MEHDQNVPALGSLGSLGSAYFGRAHFTARLSKGVDAQDLSDICCISHAFT